MTDNNMHENELQQPIISPRILLTISALSFVLALIILATQPAFGVIGFGSLAVGILSLVLLGVLAPGQLVNFITGRSFRFGGTSVLVTVVFVAVLVTVYWFIAGQNWTYDLSQTDNFSLNEEVRDVISQIGVDPNVEPIEIIAFFDATQASTQEQTEILLSDFVDSSNGKLSYRVVNPDRNPTLAQLYGVLAGDFVVIPANLSDTPESSVDESEVVNARFGFNQNQLANAILSVAASGDFRAYFLDVEDALSITDTSPSGISDIETTLTDRYRWTVEEVSLLDLASEVSSVELLDSNADGEVMVIVGGSKELTTDELSIITDYLDNGGDVVIFAAPDLDTPSLASTAALNDYLYDNFGVRFIDNIILDPEQSFQTADFPAITELSRSNFITNNVEQGSALIMPFVRSIEVDTVDNVVTTDLARSSATSYAKTVSDLLAENFQKTTDDPEGPFTVATASENTQTGARLVLIGSIGTATNQFALFQGVANQQVSFNSLVWATSYNDFFATLPQVAPFDVRPQDAPIIADNAQLRLINFVSLFALPFGILLIGSVVWALRRNE